MPPEDNASAGLGPCAGIRVVDMTSVVAGPMCAGILADLGAEVIKIEAEGSDLLRAMAPQHLGISGAYETYNHGKKSVVLDLKTSAGRDLAADLAATADVFIQNSRPGVMERLGLGYETLRARNRKLIYLSINGYGDTGPYAERPAYDHVIQGLTGFMPVQGGGGDPAAIRSPIADKLTAVWGSHAVVSALLHRERSADGEGQKVVVSLLGAYGAFIMSDSMGSRTFRSSDAPPVESLGPGSYQVLGTADGAVIGLVLQTSQFEGFLKVLDREDLLGDPRFSSPVIRAANVKALFEEVADQARAMSTATFLDLAAANGAPFAKVNGADEFFEDPQVIHSEGFVDFEDPEFGVIRHLNFPVQFAGSPANVRRRAPKLGEHTAEILGELRGAAASK